MKTNDRFSVLISRVSIDMITAYDRLAGVDIRAENAKLIRAEETISSVSKKLVYLLFVALFAMIPTVILLRWSGMDSAPFAILVAAILVLMVCIVVLLCWRELLYRAENVSDESLLILEKFEIAVKFLKLQGAFIDREAVGQNLQAMAREIVTLEDRVEFLCKSGVPAKTNRILWIRETLEWKNKILVEALNAQATFGLDFTRREIFRGIKH